MRSFNLLNHFGIRISGDPNSGVRIIGGPRVVYKIILFCSGGSLPTAARFRIFKTSYIHMCKVLIINSCGGLFL